MHDTALRIGCLAMDIYTGSETPEILEIGASNVNGSLRDHATASTHYIGVDFDAGPGVDIVIEPGAPLPVPDDAFDLVLASSVFEHDSAFWMTFLEMCRKVRPGGYLYINAPSNGIVHRYPRDNWRFYPDAGQALAQWAVSQGQGVTLVESFIAEREGDFWNDFVAVFRKGGKSDDLPARLLHQEIASSNVLVGESTEFIRPRERPEDMLLIQTEREAAEALRLAQRDRDELALQDRHRLADLESTLAQRQEEIAQTGAELAEAREIAAALTADVARLVEREAALRGKLEEESAWTFRLAGDRQTAEKAAAAAHARYAKAEQQLDSAMAEVERLTRQVTAASSEVQANVEASAALEREKRDVESRIAERFVEIGMLSRLLREQENLNERSTSNAGWLRELSTEMITRPWWWGVMPRLWRERKIARRLSRRGLFDKTAYLARYPDVAAEGVDPLRHYLLHGIDEERNRDI